MFVPARIGFFIRPQNRVMFAAGAFGFFARPRLRPPPRLSASLSIRRFSADCLAPAMLLRQKMFDQVVLISERRSVDEGNSPEMEPILCSPVGLGSIFNTLGLPFIS